MTPATTNAHTPRSGLSDKLKTLVLMLDDSSGRMEAALIRQDVTGIWEVLAEQERVAAEFEQYSCLWGHFASANRGNPEVEKSITEINDSFERVRERNRANMVLIKSFLSAINKSLQKSGTQSAKRNAVYGRHGKMTRNHPSLVFKHEG